MEETWEFAALMGEENEISVSVSSDSIDASLKGEPAKDALKILKSLMAPLLARQEDKAELIRHQTAQKYIKHIHDEEVTAQIAAKALGYTREKGLPVVMPRDKFLIPFLSSASLEDNSDQNPLPDMYSKLLAAELSGDNANGVLYIDLLRKFSSQHVHLLEKFRKKASAQNLALPINRISDETIVTTLFQKLEPFREIGGFPKNDCDDLVRHVLLEFDVPGLIVFSFSYGIIQSIDQSENDELLRQIDATQRPIPYHSEILDALESSGLVVRKMLQENGGFHQEYFIEYVKLTPMGIDFVISCMV